MKNMYSLYHRQTLNKYYKCKALFVSIAAAAEFLSMCISS